LERKFVRRKKREEEKETGYRFPVRGCPDDGPLAGISGPSSGDISERKRGGGSAESLEAVARGPRVRSV